MTQQYSMLVKTDAGENNNKFYEVKLEDDGAVIGRNGRVGTPGVIQNKKVGDYSGQEGFDKLVREKVKKGYKPVEIVTSTAGAVNSPAKQNLAEVAKRDIANNEPLLDELLTRLMAQNRFELLKASGGQIDIVDGEVKTPVGLVSLNNVDQAKGKLTLLSQLVDAADTGNEYTNTLQDYLMLVPQKIPLKRGWDKGFFSEFTTFPKQSELLEQLENSIKNSKPVVRDATDDAAPIKKVFGYSMRLVTDPAAIAAIRRYYADNMNRGHACSHLKLKNVYELVNEEKHVEYDKTVKVLGNEKRLWHGTRAHSVLSILKSGLIIPTSAGGYTITGRMFGDGVYFSDQSSKSLNYSYGYWSGSINKNSKDSYFMFLAMVAMGKSFTPNGPISRIPPSYHSMFAVGGKSGVTNNEMVVYKLNQFELRYLCEFE